MVRHSRSRKVIDISKRLPQRINLTYNGRQSPSFKILLHFFTITLMALYLLGLAHAPTTAIRAAEHSDNEESREDLEEQLGQLEEQITEYQKTINDYRSQGITLNNEIRSLNAKIAKLNLQIKAVDLSMQKLEQEIDSTQNQISQTENKIDNHKESLVRTIRSLYEADSQSLVEVLIANDHLSDFFGDLNNIALIQQNLRIALNNVINLRQELLEQKEELSLERRDVENLKSYRLVQKRQIQSTKTTKNTLLKVTKGKESEYQKILKETKKTASQIRSQIFKLLGGGELTFEEAYQYARLAEQSTGIRASLILAVLDRESLFGKNVGQCNYKKAMHPTRDIPVFLKILKKLNIDPNSTIAKVSCPNRDGAYGGAMGPAQFIPATWKIYEDEIAQITGNNPPSPWSNADAFVATSLYLQDSYNSSGCRNYAEKYKHIVPKQTLQERCSAAKYYAGGRWFYYRFIYGDPVVDRANEFQKDIDILNS